MDLHSILVIVAGLVAPALSSVIQSPKWKTQVQWCVSALSALGLAGAAQAATNGISADQLMVAAAVAFSVAQAVYHLVYKHSSLKDALEQIKLPILHQG